MENSAEEKVIVRCPHCGYEYLLGEIFYPETAIGQPQGIIRDPLGHIIYNEYKEGSERISSEKYYCDNCGKAFIAELDIKVKTVQEDPMLDFSDTRVKLF